MHICGVQKTGIDDLICKTEIEAQTWRTNTCTTRGGRGSRMNWEIGIDIYDIYMIDIYDIDMIDIYDVYMIDIYDIYFDYV